MALSMRTKILLSISAVGVLCTATSVYVARDKIRDQAVEDLTEKSKAILSRLDVGSCPGIR